MSNPESEEGPSQDGSGEVPVDPSVEEKWPKWARRFLEKLVETRSVKDACFAIGKERSTAKRLRDRAPAFGKAWDEIMEVHREALETSAMTLATEGSIEPVYQGGRLVGFTRKYYPALMAFMLTAHLPKTYRVSDDGTPQWTPAEYAKATFDLRAQMEATVPREPPPTSEPGAKLAS